MIQLVWKLLRLKLYHCYKCGKFKPSKYFFHCDKEHVVRVRGANIGFTCKKCFKKHY